MRSGAEILEALDSASKEVQRVSNALSKLIIDFYEVLEGPEGELILGIGLRYDIARKEELSRIYEEHLVDDMRPPAEDIRAAMAEKRVRTKQPDLWAKYHSMRTEIEAKRMWISNQKAAISANQSLLKGERE